MIQNQISLERSYLKSVKIFLRIDVIYGNKEKECRKRGEVIRGMFCIVLEHHRIISFYKKIKIGWLLGARGIEYLSKNMFDTSDG